MGRCEKGAKGAGAKGAKGYETQTHSGSGPKE